MEPGQPKKKTPQASEGHSGKHEEMAHPAQTGYPVCLCPCVFVLKRRPTHLDRGQQGRRHLGWYGNGHRHSCEGDTGRCNWSGHGKKPSNGDKLTSSSAGGNGATLPEKQWRNRLGHGKKASLREQDRTGLDAEKKVTWGGGFGTGQDTK